MRPLPWLMSKKVRQSFSTAPQLFAEAVAGGQVEHPDADDGEEQQAGDPDVAGDVVLLHLGDDEAADHRARGMRGRCLASWGLMRRDRDGSSDMAARQAQADDGERVWVRNQKASRPRSPSDLPCVIPV